MSRHLDFFDQAVAATIERPLADAYARGARKVLVAGVDRCNGELRSLLNSVGFTSVDERWLSDIQAVDISANDLLVICSASSADVSHILHACIGKTVEVIAPISDHHISKRTVFLMSIPKAGTHMMIRLLGLMGLKRSSDRNPLPGTWSTPVGYEYHAPCRELLVNDWFNPLGRHLFFRSPAIFVYRNPLDIVVSELDWFVKPEHSFSGYLNCCTDDRERLSRLIADDSVMGTIRDRINRYAGWMSFGNVIPVSYEELVGACGGGEDTQQADSIWALQLKLQVAGCPEAFGRQLYDSGSATFSKGKVGRHRERFTDEHWTVLDTLPQDFMRALGYAKGSATSSRVEEMLKRPLVVKQLSDEQLYTAKLIREDYLGWNIVEIAGQYFPVQQGQQITSPAEAMAFSDGHDGFMTIADAEESIIQGIASRLVCEGSSPISGTVLSVEGFLDFNIVQHQGCWYAFKQAVGPLDIAALDAHAVESMKAMGQCLTGINIADVKAEILRKALLAHIDQIQLRSDTELKSVQEQLFRLKERKESAVAHGAETEQRLDELRALIDEARLRSVTELKSVQEQLGRIVNNPFARLANITYRSMHSMYRFVFRGKR